MISDDVWALLKYYNWFYRDRDGGGEAELSACSHLTDPSLSRGDGDTDGHQWKTFLVFICTVHLSSSCFHIPFLHFLFFTLLLCTVTCAPYLLSCTTFCFIPCPPITSHSRLFPHCFCLYSPSPFNFFSFNLISFPFLFLPLLSVLLWCTCLSTMSPFLIFTLYLLVSFLFSFLPSFMSFS